MHANLNTTLFYDLVLLIECSNWKSTPTLNTMQKSRSPGWSHDPGLKASFWADQEAGSRGSLVPGRGSSRD